MDRPWAHRTTKLFSSSFFIILFSHFLKKRNQKRTSRVGLRRVSLKIVCACVCVYTCWIRVWNLVISFEHFFFYSHSNGLCFNCKVFSTPIRMPFNSSFGSFSISFVILRGFQISNLWFLIVLIHFISPFPLIIVNIVQVSNLNSYYYLVGRWMAGARSAHHTATKSN